MTQVHGRWPLNLPEPRASWGSWSTWEKDRMLAIYACLQPGDIVLDIGSEHGDFAALYQRWVGPEGGVIMCDPSAAMWPHAKQIWEMNDLPAPLATFHGFVADQGAATAALNWGGWPEAADGPIEDDPAFMHLNEGGEVPRITVDMIAKALYEHNERWGRVITLVTMDVEGAEAAVHLGARHTLMENRPDVFTSIHPEYMRERYDHEPLDLVDEMVTVFDYEALLLDTHHEEHWFFKPRP